jgi:hypothetical protein
MKDPKTHQWRPRKSWGGAGKGAHKVAGRPAPARPTAGKKPGRPRSSKSKAKPRKPEQLHVVEPLDQGEPLEDEFLPFLGADPDPSWQQIDGGEAAPAAGGEQLDLRTEVESWIALGWSLPAEMLATMDPFCFGPLVDEQTGPLIVSCFADIAMQSPKVAEFIASKSGLMPYIKLGFAFKPVFQNAWRHHISKKVEVEVDRDAMTYKVTQRDYSQYPAA